jgi:peptidyl-tRNA hydrolase, PTH1 family
LIVGLGNPGDKYDCTRHNAGFMAVDKIVHCYGFSEERKKFDAFISGGSIGGYKVITAKPQTYMNLSGKAVSEIVRFYKIPIDKVIVIHDEIDLAVAKVKVKQGGGSAGHNGLKSLDSAIGKNYWRVRIGVGRPERQSEVSDYVLRDFKNDEKIEIEEKLQLIAEEINTLLENQPAVFLNDINGCKFQ